MNDTTLTIHEAASRLTKIVNPIRINAESTLLTDKGEPVARIVPVEHRKLTAGELVAWWPTRPRLDPEDINSFEADPLESRKILVDPTPSWD